jgi:hypothetical protein
MTALESAEDRKRNTPDPFAARPTASRGKGKGDGSIESGAKGLTSAALAHGAGLSLHQRDMAANFWAGDGVLR